MIPNPNKKADGLIGALGLDNLEIEKFCPNDGVFFVVIDAVGT